MTMNNRFVFSLLATWITFFSDFAGAGVKFGLPADCIPGKTCFIQNFVDMDPSAARKDPGCGIATYNGHKGTDLRLRSLREMADGVSVLAIADGTVLRIRDNVLDRLVRSDKDRDRIKGKECGNGLILDHGGGWTSQYCHMKRRSLIVQPGHTLAKGAKLGEIGISGKTQFPHIHITIRHNDELVDPMTGGAIGAKCSKAAKLPSTTLWDAKTAGQLSLDATAMLEAGFAEKPVSGEMIMSGIPPELPGANSKSYILWTRLINLKKGDQIGFRIEGKNGVLVKNTAEPMTKDQASWTGFAGRRRSLEPGKYSGEVALIRDNKIILHRRVSLSVQSR